MKQDPQINIGCIEGSSFGYLHHEVDQCSDISEGRTVSIFRVAGSGSGEAEVDVNKGIFRLHQKEKIWPIRAVEGEQAQGFNRPRFVHHSHRNDISFSTQPFQHPCEPGPVTAKKKAARPPEKSGISICCTVQKPKR